MTSRPREPRSEAEEGPLYRISMKRAEPYVPPPLSDVLTCLADDKHMVDACLAKACIDPQRKTATVPIQLLARFSALAGDVMTHLWKHYNSDVMEAPIEWESEP